MTGKKTSFEFAEAVQPIARLWKSRGWGPKDLINAAIVLFHKASAADREAARAVANLGSPITPAEISDDAEFQEHVRSILKTLAEIPSGTGRAPASKTAKGH